MKRNPGFPRLIYTHANSTEISGGCAVYLFRCCSVNAELIKVKCGLVLENKAGVAVWEDWGKCILLSKVLFR